jgi:group II intron reverse transcriptase/maturase
MNVERRDSIRQPEPPSQLGKFQEEDGVKAKPFTIDKWRFVEAYRLVKANAGAAGVDKQSLEDFEKNLKDNLYKLWNRMSSGSYMPPPVKGVEIPKKSGGKRLLGVPAVYDRVAQMVVKLEFEPVVEPHFLPDSYGYRPNKSALQAIDVTRKRCWKLDWVLEFDIKGLFDNIPHDLLLKAVDKHTDIPWVRLYIRRWLTAAMQLPTGQTVSREKGTPQGGVISPILANLFLHYAFDKWLQTHYPHVKWCRYADDGLVHCKSEAQACFMLRVLRQRFGECGLELHTEKTKIVYCKDGRRKRDYCKTSFDFLGYNFRCRSCKDPRTNQMFLGFMPAVSSSALKAMRQKIRKMRIRSRTDLSLAEIAAWINPLIRGWLMYYGAFYRSEMYRLARHINKTVVRWLMRRFKYLRGRETKAMQFLERVVRESPSLFVHWRQGMVGRFA